MLGERFGEATCSGWRASLLLARGGGGEVPMGVRVLREAEGEMLGVWKGEGVGVVSGLEGLCGGVGVNCWEEKPESLEMRFSVSGERGRMKSTGRLVVIRRSPTPGTAQNKK